MKLSFNLTHTNLPLVVNKSFTASIILFLSLWNGNKNIDLYYILVNTLNAVSGAGGRVKRQDGFKNDATFPNNL